MIICKFGGKATTSKLAIKNIKNIKQNQNRKVFVFSAIGSDKLNIKLTDLLIKIHQNRFNFKSLEKGFISFKLRMISLLELTKTQMNLDEEIKKIKSTYLKNYDKNYLISRGEFLTAKIMANYLNLKFVKAEEFMFFKDKKIDEIKTKNKLNQIINKHNRIVVPGFYGIDENKKVLLFKRGGSDLTGAIISKLLAAEKYENYSDVDGVYSLSPNFGKSEKILKMNYEDLLFMTNFNTKIMQHDSVKILANTLIKLEVRSIFNIKTSGTIVTKSCKNKLQFIVYKRYNDKILIIKKDLDDFYHSKFYEIKNFSKKIKSFYKINFIRN